MTLHWMDYQNFDEYLAKPAQWTGKRTWLTLATLLLHQGNTLVHGDWHISAFETIALCPRRHSAAWLFENYGVTFGAADEICLFGTPSKERLQSICDDPYQWTANGVPLPEVLNTYCQMVSEMDKGVAFYSVEGEMDYAGGQAYHDTLWYTGEYAMWCMVHVDGLYDNAPCSCDPEECRFVSQCEEHDPYSEEIHYVKWMDEPVEKYLFKLHAKHSLTGFKPYALDATERRLAENTVRKALKLPIPKPAES